MDLSFPRFDRAAELVGWPGDLAVLMIGIVARQGESRTAVVQAGLPIPPCAAVESATADRGSPLFAPRDCAFNGTVAAALVRWSDDGDHLPDCRREE